MRRPGKKSAFVMLIALVGAALVPSLSPGEGGGQSPLVPPNAKYRGKSFAEWNVLASEWAIATGLGGEDRPDTVKGVRFLPGNFAGDEFDITVEAGTAIAGPAFFVFGELYDNGSMDNPNDPIIPLFLQTSYITTRLNGQVVLQGFASDLADYGFGPTAFEEPIYYAEPQPRGPDLNSVAATFVFGIGSVYHPLPVGEHTLVIDLETLFFGNFQTTYHITVTPRGR